ncbi:WecB/TagA/CpsF family glycosyltransferase [Bacillus haimaensis]|uniref:WecB/TagA/CpsF family glycosyltransferase n=1 Tax=Bacillus haimaensis TaxID=3160967 RepID=UPI003AA946C3
MNFFGINLFLGKKIGLVNLILDKSLMGEKKAYYALNPDCFLISLKNKGYKKILNEDKNLIYVDGMGIIYTQRFLKMPIAEERIATTDLFPALCEKISKEKLNLNIFLLGGKEDTAERVIKNFNKKYPYVSFVGYQNGFFNEEQEINIINKINEKNVDILFVGLGCPKQELWVDKHLNKLNVNSVITCGGLFDYYAGNVNRAPKFMRENGLEWLYRLFQEPSRLYKRYIFGNIRYVVYMFIQKLKGSKKRSEN